MQLPNRNVFFSLGTALLAGLVYTSDASAHNFAAGHSSHGGGHVHVHTSSSHYHGHGGYGGGYGGAYTDYSDDGSGFFGGQSTNYRDDLHPKYYAGYKPVFTPMQGDADLGTVNYSGGKAEPAVTQAKENEARMQREMEQLNRGYVGGTAPHAVAPVDQRAGYYQGGVHEFSGTGSAYTARPYSSEPPAFAAAQQAAMSPDVQEAQMQIVRAQLDMARSFAASGNNSQAERTYGTAIDALRRIPGQDAALREALTARSNLLRQLGNTSAADILMQQATMH